jgi:aspartyl protease family protein
MTTSFNPVHGLIVISVRLFGPSGDLIARLALDTGASSTVVRNALLITIGYDPDALPRTVHFTTESGVESAPRLVVGRVAALNQERLNFPVVAHTLPPSASIDGVLGLDFLRNRVLTLDFINGEISLD